MGKIITLGEIMLRLKSPNHERFFQNPLLEATFGGGEANVAVSLSLFGKETYFVSSVPENPVGEAAIQELRKYGVNTSFVNKVKNARLGIYFLESGSNARPSVVVYDRENSAIANANVADFSWNKIFENGTWFHITGITPAISKNAQEVSLEAVKQAKSMGLTVSIDLNYRKKLWNYGKKPSEVMKELVKYADVLIANEEDIQKSLEIQTSIDVTKGQLDINAYKKLIQSVKKDFPNLSTIAITLRESFSADNNAWSGILYNKDRIFVSQKYQIQDIVDRVGGGDAFSAGLIFGLDEYQNDFQKALDFAVAASALKHTISGDFNLVNKNEVLSLMEGNGSGRVQR